MPVLLTKIWCGQVGNESFVGSCGFWGTACQVAVRKDIPMTVLQLIFVLSLLIWQTMLLHWLIYLFRRNCCDMYVRWHFASWKKKKILQKLSTVAQNLSIGFWVHLTSPCLLSGMSPNDPSLVKSNMYGQLHLGFWTFVLSLLWTVLG